MQLRVPRCSILLSLVLSGGLIGSLAAQTSRTHTPTDTPAAAAKAAAATADSDAKEAPLPTAFRNIFWQPNALLQGSVTFITVEMAAPATRVSGRFLGKELSFFKGDKPSVWYALAGVDLETAPGTYDLAINAVVPRRGLAHAVRRVAVASGDFKSGTVEVPENFVTPDAAGKRQIAQDAALKSRVYAHFIAQPQWSGDFRKPVDAPSTPSFGMTRVYNEEMTSQHRGTDFPAKEGAIVSASNAGTVVLAKELFYEGNCVIVDHGQHLFTIYMHLAKMDVNVGDKVKKGDHLGLSGATGRVTGPHMHMGVRWNGAYLDPTKLLAMTLPETGAKVDAEPVHPARTRKATRKR